MQYSMIVLLHVVLLPALLWSQPFQEAIRQPSADNLIRRSVGQIRVPPRLVFAQDGGHSQDFIDIHFKDAVKRRNFEARYDGYEVRMDRAALAIAPDGSVLIAPITEPTGATQEFAISINKGGVLLSLQLVLELDPETGILTKYVVADPASGEGREIDFVTGSINLIESSVPKATSGERQALSDVLACIFGNFIAPSTVCGNAAGIISAVRNAISLTCPQSLIANLVSAIGTSIFCGGVECVIQAVTGPPPAGPPAAGLALVNNVGVGDTVLTGGKKNYTFAIPSGASNLTVTLAGTGGDADLYVKFGSEPTVGNQVNNSTNCVPYTGGSNEVCTISNPAAGTWYIVVHGYSTALYALKANYTVASLPPAGPSSSSQNFPGMVNNGQTSAFVTVNVASGQSLVRFMLSWSGGGDLDLHVYSPSSNHYGYGAIIPQGYNYTANPEIITITNPAPGPYRFQVNGYSAPGGRSYQVVVQTQ